MAVVSITPIRGGESEHGADERRYLQNYLIVCDSDTDDHLTIRTSAEFLALTQGHYVGRDGAEDEGAFLERGRLRNKEDLPAHWEFEAEFSTFGGETSDPNNPDNNPLLEPPEVHFGWREAKEPLKAKYDLTQFTQIDFTKATLGVMNSARELFNPPPEIDAPRQVVRITRNEAFLDPIVVWYYSQTLNYVEFWNAPQGHLLMIPITADRQFKTGRFYWKVTYEMHFKKDGWEPRLLDHGSYYWDGGYDINNPPDPQDKKDFMTKTGAYIDGLLDGAGDRLDEGDDPVYLDHEDHGFAFQYTNFQDLNLGDPDILIFQ